MKKHMKFITILLVLTLCLSLVACGGTDKEDETTSGTVETTPETNPEDVNLGNPEYSSEYTEGLEFALNDDGVTYKVKDYKGSATEVVIPRIYKGGLVTYIGSDSLWLCTSMTSITIPDSVTSIGDFAFSGCSSLTSITIPDSVTSIGDSAFYYCISLTSITIGGGVTSIGESAFSGCTSLSSISIDKNNSIYKSEGNCIIEKATNTLVTGCKASIIPVGVTSIGEKAFSYCTSLANITISDSVSLINNRAFENCNSLTSINILANVTLIGDYTFYKCTALTNITLPDSLTYIGNHAFDECTSLTSITIPDSTTLIGDSAFYNCTSLTSITIPNNATYIGDRAFFGCESLTNINFNGTIEQWNSINKLSYWDSNTGNYTIHCTNGDIEKD